MNAFEKGVAEHIGKAALEKIQKARIGIAGVGGLGSNCAVFLTRSGFKKFSLADFDTVAPSNLNRQFYFTHQIGRPKVEMLKDNLLMLNPDLEIRLFQEKLTAETIRSRFADCHIIVEGFDTAADKKMLVESFITSPSDPLIVSASGIAGWGESDRIRIHLIRRNFFLIGDLSTPADDDHPSMAPRVTIAAAKQADIVLTHILGRANVSAQGGDS